MRVSYKLRKTGDFSPFSPLQTVVVSARDPEFHFDDLDPEYVHRDDPGVLHHNFMDALNVIGAMVVLTPRLSFAFPTVSQLLNLLHYVHTSLDKSPEPDVSSPLLIQFLLDIVDHPDLSRNECLMEVIGIIYLKISVLDFTPQTLLIVPSARTAFGLGSDRLKEICIRIFSNSLVEPISEAVVYDLDVPLAVLRECKATQSEDVRLAAIAFLSRVAWVTSNEKGTIRSRQIGHRFLEESFELNAKIFQGLDGGSRLFEFLVPGCLGLFECLLENENVVTFALTRGFLQFFLASFPLMTEPEWVKMFFEVLELIFQSREMEGVTLSSAFFANFSEMVERACRLSTAGVYVLLAVMNKRFWRELVECGLVRTVMAAVADLAFEMTHGACLWVIDLLACATIDVRREVADPYLMELCIRNLECENMQAIDAIGSALITMHSDDPEFWNPVFGECGLLDGVEGLIYRAADDEVTGLLTQLRDALLAAGSDGD
jgi:hypothetical protein